MKKIILLFNCLITFTSLAFSEYKIGWIDSEEVMKNLDEVKQIEVELEKKQRQYQSDMVEMKNKLDSLLQDYQVQQFMLTDERKQTKQQEMMKLEQSLQNYQMEKLGPEGEIYRVQAQLFRPVEVKIRDAITKVGNERGYDYILDARTGAIVHALDAHNLTDEVLEVLTKSESEEK